MFTAASVLLLGNPWLIAMAKAKKAAEAQAAGASDSDAGECLYSLLVGLISFVLG